MESAGHNSYDLYRKTGLQPSTIRRFLNGDSAHLKPDTVVRLARFYGITESQLRGDMPIAKMEVPREQHELEELLPLDEYRFLSKVKSMDDKARATLYYLAEMLVAEPQAVYQANSGERRQKDVFPNPQLRAGESRYKSQPTQRRRKTIHTDARKYLNTSSKPHQRA